MAKILASVPDTFAVLSGDDAVTLPLISLGGRGIISVASNQIPAEMSQLAAAALRGDFETARRFQRKYQDLMDVNFIESNPQPVKYAMSLMGLLAPIWRLPMIAPQPVSKQKIESVLRSSGLLGGAQR
jgi:4-hydroxy-tetrahydrodipicolinate synthase